MNENARNRRREVRALSIVALLIAASGLAAGVARGTEMEVAFEHEGDPVYSVLPPGKIPAIEEPRFLSGEEAAQQMAPEEPVLGITVDDEARAYSLWQLDAHEIVNDRAGGAALAATW
jgi:hypothetical protein